MTMDIQAMKSVNTLKAAQFKARCLQLMEEVKEKHISITITKHGKPIARLVPIETEPYQAYGCLKNTITIKGNLLDPIDAEWESTK